VIDYMPGYGDVRVKPETRGQGSFNEKF